MKVIEADTNKRKYILCSWIERINIVKNDHTTQDNLQIQRNLYQITGGIFHKTRTKKNFFNLHGNRKYPSQNNLEREE